MDQHRMDERMPRQFQQRWPSWASVQETKVTLAQLVQGQTLVCSDGKALSVETLRLREERESVDVKVGRQITPK